MLTQTLIRLNGIVCFVIGMALNSLLVVLSLKNRSTANDKSYKPIVLQLCITDILALIFYTFYMPAYVGAGNYGIFYTVGFFNDLFDNAPVFTQIVFSTCFFFMFLYIFSPSVQFLYRYLILCRDWKPSYRLYTKLYSVIIILLLSYVILISRERSYVSRTSNALYKDSIFTDNPASVDLLVFNRDSSKTWPAIVMFIFVTIAITIVVVCGVKIWLHLRRQFKLVSDSNKSNQRLQRQISYVLFIQGGMTVIGNLVPLFLSVFVNMKAEYTGFLHNFFILVTMVVNPLLTLLLVDTFRRAVLNLCLCKPSISEKVIILNSIVQNRNE